MAQLSDKEVRTKTAGLSIAFTESVPIHQASLFSGRLRQIQQMLDSLLQKGRHIILYGERGVGKTSLATVIKEIAESAGIEGMVSVAVNCTPSDTFESLWQNILKELIRVTAQLPISDVDEALGEVTPSERFAQAATGLLEADEIGPEDLRFALSSLGSPLIVLDELDQLSDARATMLLANTVKTLSDHWIGTTVLMVGVADSVDELIKEHASVERNLIQVHMPRMSPDELEGIINRGLSVNQMEITEDAKNQIVKLSMGLPQYTHQITKYSGFAALEQRRLKIKSEDVTTAVKDCVGQAQASISRAYHTAISSPRSNNIFAEVLLACALAKTNDLGYFSPRDVCEPLAKVLNRPVLSSSTFQQQLTAFCSAERGNVLHRRGKERDYTYRFASPMVMTHVVLRGYAEGMMPLDA